MQLFKK